MKKKISFILISILVIVAIFSFVERDVVFQEGNPFPFIEGMINLNFAKDKIVKIETKNKISYMVKVKDGNKNFVENMKKKSWDFKDQIGSTFVFKKENIDKKKQKELNVKSRMFTRYYIVFEMDKKDLK